MDDFWHGVVGYSKVKYPFKECIEYIIKYHINKNDISKYEDSIDIFFLKNKISTLDELFKKSFSFFTKNKIKVKMEYLNLILVYYHVSNYSDCDMQDLLAFCIHYDIFHDYQKILEIKFIKIIRFDWNSFCFWSCYILDICVLYLALANSKI